MSSKATLLTTSAALLSRPLAKEWVIDSGATSHISMNRSLVDNLDQSKREGVVTANNSAMECQGVGESKFKPKDGDPKTVCDVMYIPSLFTNLLSVKQMAKKGFVSVFDDTGCKVYHKSDFEVRGQGQFTGTLRNGLYIVDQDNKEPVRALNAVGTSDHVLWHKRLGHLNRKGMRALKEGMADGVNLLRKIQKLV